MPDINDQDYLLNNQYRDAANLDARVRLHQMYSTNPYNWHRWCFDQLDLPPDARVLELGCGPGYLWRENLDRIPPEWTVIVSDFSAGMLDQARANLAGRAFSFELIDAQVIPYDDATFDAVIANHMLYHIPDRAAALSEMRRVLNTTGAAYLATNGQRHLRELYALRNRFSLDSNFGWNARAHDLFSLDTGGDELRRWFNTVELRRFHDNLMVTAAAPLVDYILSMANPEAVEQHRAELTAFIEAELQAEGVIHITKDSGLLIAR